MKKTLTLAFVLFSIGASGCNLFNKKNEAPGAAPENNQAAVVSLDVVGRFTDNYGYSHEITSETWTMSGYGATSIFHIQSYSTTERYVIARNDDNNPYDPGKYSRFDYTIASDGTISFCQTSYGSSSALDALAVPAASAVTFSTTGCGGFPFSTLTQVP